jgi:SET domain-containing protein
MSSLYSTLHKKDSTLIGMLLNLNIVGPIQKINHACLGFSNCKFKSYGGDMIALTTTKPIECGQELLIEYEKGFFGDGCGCEGCLYGQVSKFTNE